MKKQTKRREFRPDAQLVARKRLTLGGRTLEPGELLPQDAVTPRRALVLWEGRFVDVVGDLEPRRVADEVQPAAKPEGQGKRRRKTA